MSLPTPAIRQSSASVSPGEISRNQWRGLRNTREKASSNGDARTRRSFSIDEARSGDHAAIHHLLMSLLHGPTESEYQSSLDRPGYDPGNRLLLRHGDELVGHIRLTRRQCRVGRAWLPTCEWSEFAILPEYAGGWQIQKLLDSAAMQAVEEGAVILTSRARQAEAFQDDRWSVCGESVCWEASQRDLLARCADELQHYGVDSIHVRPWRYVEQDALCQLYEANAKQIDGALHRDEDYWQWLLVRRGFDSILVVTNDAPVDDESTIGPSGDIVAYAFQRDGDIVELMASPDSPEASVLLVQRIAADAIERDDHQVRVFGPPVSGPLVDIMNRILPSKDGSRSVGRRPSQVVRVVDYPAFIKTSWNSSREHLRGDCRLGIRLDDEAMTIEVLDGTLHVETGKLPRAQVHARAGAVTSLLLGQVNWDRIDENPHIEVSSASASRLAARLFQPVKLWRSTLDDLPSCK